VRQTLGLVPKVQEEKASFKHHLKLDPGHISCRIERIGMMTGKKKEALYRE
jgi:hypothetical protein